MIFSEVLTLLVKAIYLTAPELLWVWILLASLSAIWFWFVSFFLKSLSVNLQKVTQARISEEFLNIYLGLLVGNAKKWVRTIIFYPLVCSFYLSERCFGPNMDKSEMDFVLVVVFNEVFNILNVPEVLFNAAEYCSCHLDIDDCKRCDLQLFYVIRWPSWGTFLSDDSLAGPLSWGTFLFEASLLGPLSLVTFLSEGSLLGQLYLSTFLSEGNLVGPPYLETFISKGILVETLFIATFHLEGNLVGRGCCFSGRIEGLYWRWWRNNCFLERRFVQLLLNIADLLGLLLREVHHIFCFINSRLLGRVYLDVIPLAIYDIVICVNIEALIKLLMGLLKSSLYHWQTREIGYHAIHMAALVRAVLSCIMLFRFLFFGRYQRHLIVFLSKFNWRVYFLAELLISLSA